MALRKMSVRVAAMLALALAGALMPDAALALDKVVLRINFTPWGMHAPLFGGRAQGFYKAEGIDLEIRSASEGQQNEIFVGTGREQFGLSNADSFVKARANGVPVVAIMADQPDTPNAIITLKKSGIEKPAQLKGKKMAWFQKNAVGLLDPVLESGGLKPGDITLVPVARGAEVQMLAAGQVDALFGYAYGQGMTLAARGFPVNIMALSDYGVKLYGTLFYTSDALVKSNPELVKRFVRATLKSIDWTREHMEQAVAEVIKVSPDRDLKLETKKLEIIYGIYKSPDYAARFGAMNDAKWQSSVDLMAPDLPRKPTPKELYTNAFVDGLDEARTLATHLRAPTN
ncbi:MAG: ABC transporter substrate-binding protein [Variibacter sp.]|nr:ABC transporter substrate-binding protein [Variibacter sp.]